MTTEIPNLTEEQAYRQLVCAVRVLCPSYAIAVFTPDELQGADPTVVEAAMIAKGFEKIEDQNANKRAG